MTAAPPAPPAVAASPAVADLAGTKPAEPARRHQWHHKASKALGFNPPRRHLSRTASIALIAAAVLAVVGVPVAILTASGAFERQTPSAPPSVVTADAAPLPGESAATDWSVGRSFESGDFSLEIVAYQDGLSALSADESEISENGQWVLVEIAVKNNGAKEGTFVPDQQILIVDSGAEYSNEPASALRHAESKLGALPIEPGQSQTGFLAFDIPIDSRATELRLVGRIGEPPVTVPLG
jgi:hypothetical protein